MSNKFHLPQLDKRELWIIIYHYILVTVGCALLAFGTAIFLTKSTIIAGGLTGIGLIIQHFVSMQFEGVIVVDIVVGILNAVLWLVSLIFLGKSFAAKTLWATIIFPLFLSLFIRAPVFNELADIVAGNGETGNLLLCGLFGGVISGIGVAVTFQGKGTTGGVDVLCFIGNKYFGWKVAVVSLLIDSTIILVGLFAVNFPYDFINALCGILCAAMTSTMIAIVYSKKQNAIILEVISDKWEEIGNYILSDVNRGVTYVDGVGGYTGHKKRMLRCVLSHEDYLRIREYISVIDPKAFMTFTETNAAYGEGFRENYSRKKISKNKQNNEK